jgi:hypothetical protein
MSHRHFCEFAGHHWDCQGSAVRQLLGDTEPSVCMCLSHGVPMEQGDHSECSIELLACPDHRAEQMRAMGYEPGQPISPPSDEPEDSSLFRDLNENRTIGLCLWCGQDFYSMDEVEAHDADDMAKCPAFQELKGQQCMPPVLQAMMEQAAPLKDEGSDQGRRISNPQ